jgi:hypothetical protein
MEGDWKCEVCNIRYPLGVASSRNGPFSMSYCRICLDMRADPLWAYEQAVLSWRTDYYGLAFFDQICFYNGKYIKVGLAFALVHQQRIVDEYEEECRLSLERETFRP